MVLFLFKVLAKTMKESAAVQRSVAFMVGAVGVWWVANAIATIASKNVMSGGDDRRDETGFTAAFTDWRWVELTLLQHFVGALLAGIWVKATGKSIWPENARSHTMLMYIAALGNVVGNMSTNAAFSLVSSSTAQVIKACEPLFTFVLTLLLYRNYAALDVSTLLSVVIIVVGACSFLMKDATFNIWGMVAAMISNTAFPTRNIFLKKLSDVWESPLQKFTVMSIYSTLLALPLWLVKVVAVSGFSSGKLPESIISSFFHSTYNLASITVLESVNPVSHAILNISKRLFVIIANVTYFDVPFSFHMFLSLVLLLVGCYLYQLKSGSATKMVTVMKCVLLAFFMVYLFFPESSQVYEVQVQANRVQEFRNQVLGNMILGNGGQGNEVEENEAQKNEVQRKEEQDCTEHNRISTAWIYDKPIPESVVSNLEHLTNQNPGRILYVYCGTSHCFNRIQKLRNDHIAVEFVILPTILADLPLRGWLAQNPFNKIIAGEGFEDHVQDAAALGLLWKYGGFYVNPRYKVTGKLIHPDCLNSSAWVSKERDGIELFSGAYFHRQHSLIRELADLFVNKYPTKVGMKSPFKFEFHKNALPLLNAVNPNLDLDNGVKFHLSVLRSSLSNANHFGTLTLQRRVGITSNYANLGDQVQDFPGLAYLPFRDKFLDRDAMVKYTDKDNVTVFLNAWWGDGSGSWPPPKTVHPILLSIHLSAGMAQNWAKYPEYLREREPIGCRDTSTMDFLEKLNVKAYFSGCMTLQMPSPYFNVKRNGKIYIVDLNQKYVKMLPQEIQKIGIEVRHDWLGEKSPEARFTKAYELMKKYGEAKLVITQRIHGALPCVGMNTPVVFFNTAAMPGDGGKNKLGSTRASGLTPLFHTIDFYKLDEAERAKWIAEFPWDNPPPNPNPAMMMRLRASAWNVIRKHQPLYDAGSKFGVIPMSPPEMSPRVHFTFHFVVPAETLNWRQWRSIESIFYHHPTATVTVHSNELPQDMFDVLSEAGYNIKVANYDLDSLLSGSPVEDFVRELGEARRSDNWLRRETELLRLLILYQQGGVYMDSDVILVWPINVVTTNSMGWEDNRNNTLSTAFMMFERGHSYLELCLSEFVNVYRSGYLTISASDILTRAWHQYESGDTDNVLYILPYYSFYTVIHSSSMAQQCFEDTAGQVFNATIEIVKTKAYAVKLNSDLIAERNRALKKGTVCGYLLSNYCVLCSNVY